MMRIATIGFFDGVHRGHLCLIRQLREQAERLGLQPMVVTFRNHPRQIVSPDFVPSLLTTPQEKRRLLEQAGVEVEMLAFTEELRTLTAREFMLWLHDALGVRALLMGYDHRFGHDGGTPAQYGEWGREVGVEVLMATELPEEHVSSSVCRRLLDAGQVSEAARLLGHPYLLQGKVEGGHQIGREMGFPTANVVTEFGKLLPLSGVYAVWVTLDDESRWPGMLNIGHRPTFDNGKALTIEVNLLGFTGDLYDRTITLEFVEHLRAEQRFASREALMAQLRSDEMQVRAVLTRSED
ncbi:MAG: riboflavin biosynthesis protein RibF [Bacteroidaceae bacterium]|nr:riboflavin biosynthesis protein RibF [Bacteroidaceae bacterium]